MKCSFAMADDKSVTWTAHVRILFKLWVKTTQDVDIVGPHIKMLAGDYLSYENLSLDRGVGPHCRLCQLSYQLPAPAETLEHLLTRCRATSNVRSRILPEILNTLSKYHPNNELLS